MALRKEFFMVVMLSLLAVSLVSATADVESESDIRVGTDGVRVTSRTDAAVSGSDDAASERARLRGDIRAAHDAYRVDIDEAKEQYRDDRAALRVRLDALLNEVRDNPNLTQEERESLRLELEALRRDAAQTREAYRDEARNIRVVFQDRVRNLVADADGTARYQLKDGRNVVVRVMPEVASARAIERLRLKQCNETNNCTLELREVGEGENARVRYALQATKEARLFGIFRTHMNVESEVDAETGEVVRTRRPWWAFLAVETSSDASVDEVSSADVDVSVDVAADA